MLSLPPRSASTAALLLLIAACAPTARIPPATVPPEEAYGRPKKVPEVTVSYPTIRYVSLSPDAKRGLACADDVLMVVALPEGTVIHRLKTSAMESHPHAANAELDALSSTISCLAADWPHDRAITGDYKGALRVWDLSKGKQISAIAAYPIAGYGSENFTGVAVSADGAFIYSAGKQANQHDCPIDVWDTTSGRRVRQFTLGKDPEAPPYFSYIELLKDQRRAVIANTATIAELDLTTGARLWNRAIRDVACVAASPDGTRFLVSAGSPSSLLMLGSKGRDLGTLWVDASENDVPPLAMSFLPWDSRQAITAGDAGDLALWDLEQRKPIAHLVSPGGARVRIFSLAAAAEEPYALSGGHTGIVRLWDLRNRKIVRELQLNDREPTDHDGP